MPLSLAPRPVRAASNHVARWLGAPAPPMRVVSSSATLSPFDATDPVFAPALRPPPLRMLPHDERPTQPQRWHGDAVADWQERGVTEKKDPNARNLTVTGSILIPLGTVAFTIATIMFWFDENSEVVARARDVRRFILRRDAEVEDLLAQLEAERAAAEANLMSGTVSGLAQQRAAAPDGSAR